LFRLWKRSELKKRYFIVLVKDPTFQIPSFRNYLPSSAVNTAVAPTAAGVTQKVAGGAVGVNEKKRKHIVFEEETNEENQANKQIEEDIELTEPMQEEENEQDQDQEDEGDQLQNQLRKLIGGHKNRNETGTKVNNNNRGIGTNLPSHDKKKWKNKNNNNKNKKHTNHQSN
jgi:hypothetical protein